MRTKSNVSGRAAPDWENQKRTDLGQFGLKGDEPMSKKVTSVRLPQRIEDAIAQLPQKDRPEFLRRAITEVAERELLNK